MNHSDHTPYTKGAKLSTRHYSYDNYLCTKFSADDDDTARIMTVPKEDAEQSNSTPTQSTLLYHDKRLATTKIPHHSHDNMISIDRDTDTDDAHILYPYIEVKKKSVVVQTHTELEATTPDTPVLEIDDVTNDAPVPHPYDSSYEKKPSVVQTHKRFSIVLPRRTPLHRHDEESEHERRQPDTTPVPAGDEPAFFNVEATLVPESPIYNAVIVTEDTNSQTDETQNQECKMPKRWQLGLGALVILILCIMSAIIGALSQKKDDNDNVPDTQAGQYLELETTSATPTPSSPPEAETTVLPASPTVSATISTLPPLQTATTTRSTSTSLEDIEGALLQLGINYAISSRCNLTAVDIMNENGNTVKRGLIAATESVVINILNTTFPGTRIKNGSERILLRGSTGRRSLVFYSRANPVTITYINDVLDQSICQLETNCMQVRSTIYLTFESGDNATEVESSIRSGIDLSFKDRSFFQVSALLDLFLTCICLTFWPF